MDVGMVIPLLFKKQYLQTLVLLIVTLSSFQLYLYTRLIGRGKYLRIPVKTPTIGICPEILTYQVDMWA